MCLKQIAQYALRPSMCLRVRFFCLLVMLSAGSVWSLSAQPRQATWSILETSYQTGDSVTMVISVGDANDPVNAQNKLLVIANFNPAALFVPASCEVDVSNSFFVAAGSECTSSLVVDNVDGKLTLDIVLKNGATGSGYGELARLRGTLAMEELLKQATVGEGDQPDRLLVFPNPANESIHAVLPRNHGGTVSLHDSWGRVVLEGAVSRTESRVSLPVAGIPSGYYYLRVRGDGHPYSVPVLIGGGQ